MDLRVVLAGLFIAAGCFFLIVAAIGILRFPDFYTRMHPAGKADTLGQALIIAGLIIYWGINLVSVKLLIIALFLMVANPTAAYALANAAYASGIKPWKKGEERR